MEFERSVIDSHMHLYNWFSADGKSFIDAFDGLQKKTHAEGLTIASLTDCIYGGVEINIMAAIYKLHNPTAYALADLFYPEFPVNPDFAEGLDPKSQYDELMEIGFDGFKLLSKPDLEKVKALPVNHAAFNEFFSSAERDGTYILWHVADPKANWTREFPAGPWNYSDGTFPKRETLYSQTFDVLKKHPRLNTCMAHFFFMEDEPERLEALFAEYKGLTVDVVPGLMFREFEKRSDFYRDFLTRYADRIIYGSDAEVNHNPHCEELMTAVYKALTTDEIVDIWGFKSKGIALPQDACDKILSTTFKKRCGETPRPVNTKALKRYIEKYSGFIKNEEHKRQISAFSRSL